MNMNELNRMCEVAARKKNDMELQLKKIGLKRKVLCKFSAFLKDAALNEQKVLVYKKFFEKESYGVNSYVNENFEQQYSEFLEICSIIEELCVDFDFTFSVRVYDDDRYSEGTLSRGVTVEQKFFVLSFESVNTVVFSRTLKRIIEQKYSSHSML